MIGRRLRLALTLPGLLYLGAFLLVPCSLVLVLGAFERGTYGGIDWSIWGTANLVRAMDPLYLGILVTSARIAATATGVALLLAYPAAYAIALSPRRWQPVLLVLVTLPFWSNYLIRTYAWIVLLNREGLINRLARLAGLDRRALAAALQRVRGGHRPRLQLRAVRGARDLRLGQPARPEAAGGLGRPGRPPLDHLPARSPCR